MLYCLSNDQAPKSRLKLRNMNTKMLLFCLLISTGLLGQAGTTVEEYRYLSKGYAYQIEMGLDAHKSGYEVRNLGTNRDNATIVGLYQLGANEPQGLLIHFKPAGKNDFVAVLPNEYAEGEVRALWEFDRQKLLNDPSKRTMYINALEFLALSRNTENIPPNTVATVRKAPKKPVMTTRGVPVPSGNYYNEGSDQLYSKSYGAPVPAVSKKSKDQNEAPSSYDYSQVITAPISTDHSQGKLVQVDLSTGLLARKNQVSTLKVPPGKSKGTVVVKLCVMPGGEVLSAKFTQRGSTTFDRELRLLALEHARSMFFKAGTSTEDCGTVTYHFQ